MSVYFMQSPGDANWSIEVERKLNSAIPDLKRVARIEDIGQLAFKTAERSFVILDASGAENGRFQNLIDLITAHNGDAFFIAVGGEISARDYKKLIQFGNADWVAESGLPHEVLDTMGRVRAAIGGAVAPERPIVMSFVPSAGGVGNSTLAIETAMQLVTGKAAKGAKVALIDLDFQSSHVCDYLDISPKLQFDELMASPERLDDHLLSVFVSHHAAGLEVFAATRQRFQKRELGVDALSALFERMAQRYAYIVVDLPLSAHVWTRPLLSASDAILVTGVNTIPGLRQMAETLQAIRAEFAVSGDVRAIVNKCEFSLLGNVARADHVARILGEEKRMFVRNSRVALECMNVGSPMTLACPSDKSVRDIAAIAEYCAALKPAASRRH